MSISTALLKQLATGQYTNHKLNLSKQNLTDQDIAALTPLLSQNPHIKELDVTGNSLTNASAAILAKNTTLQTLRLKFGNSAITTTGLRVFLQNTTLTKFPIIGGSGDSIKQIRQHIKSNAKKTSAHHPPTCAVTPAINAQTLFLSQQSKVMTHEEKLDFYLTKPVTHKKRKGELNFQILYAYFLLDMQVYNSDIMLISWYAAIVSNMFIHNATYTPQSGYGKSQLREYNNKSQLQYYRSQGEHPTVRFHMKLVGIPTDKRRKSRLPLNPAFAKLCENAGLSNKVLDALKALDSRGYPHPWINSKKTGYLILKIAHSGARMNNFSVLANDMYSLVAKKNAAETRSVLQNKLTTSIHSTQTVKKESKIDLVKKTNKLLNQFRALSEKSTNILQSTQTLASHLFTHRAKRTDQIRDKINTANLTNIAIEPFKGSTCLMIKLYPGFNDKSEVYKEGVTNVLLSFFGGMLNHELQRHGLYLHTERRQSFGFLRSTLTDGGSMCIRLSLGMEPSIFDEILIKCLHEFNSVLTNYKFKDPTHPSVSAVFQTPAHLKHQCYIRNAVHKDNKTYQTYHQAKAYIDEARHTWRQL